MDGWEDQMINMMAVFEHIRPDLIAEAKRRREAGQSHEEIAGWLSEATGLKVGREGVRTYFKGLGEPTRPRRSRTAITQSVAVPPERFPDPEDDPAYDEVVRVVEYHEDTIVFEHTGPSPVPVAEPVEAQAPDAPHSVDPEYQDLWNRARRA